VDPIPVGPMETAPTGTIEALEPHDLEGPSRMVAVAPGEPLPLRTTRFVWQTDGAGRFVHLSHELADAVGGANAALLGLDWDTVVARFGIANGEAVSTALAARASWSAGPVQWPSTRTAEPVPVELGGVVVRENGAFAGYRGYGIARVQPVRNEQPLPVATVGADDAVLSSEPVSRPEGLLTTGSPPALFERRRPLPILQTAPPAVLGLRTLLLENRAGAQSTRILSDQEREAFQEIARALDGGRMPPVEEEGAHVPADASLPEELAGEASDSPLVPYETLAERRARRRPINVGNDHLVQLMDKLPVALIVTQAGRAVHVNRRMLEMTGHRDLAAFVDAGDIDELFVQSPPTSELSASAFLVRGARESEIWTDARIHAFEWGKSPAMLMVLTPQAKALDSPAREIPVRDNLAQRSLELDLLTARAELRELQAVLDTAMDGIVTLDSDGRILGMNRSAEALFGYDQKEVAGEAVTTLLDPRSHSAALDYLEGLKSNGVASLLNDGREVQGRERNNGTIPLFMTIGRLNDTGPRGRFCAVLKDMSAWKKAERELEEARQKAESANANKTDFLASVSHELRTPLNAIIGFSEAMTTEQFGPVGNERYRQYAKDIHSSGTHVLSLVNDLLDLSKIAAGKFELSFERVEINAIVASAVAMLEPQANRARVVIRTQIAPGLPPVVADPRSIRQIVLNLLSNATRYTKPGGQAIVSTSLSSTGEAVIRIRDTGVGMTPTEIAHAMEPFRQVGDAPMDGGTGLGLPLTKALVEANRAHFRIESSRGEGTLTEVVFPATRVLAE
ncbi:MAG: PAS domain-containing sensor histidine kinase, partial [Beijerinckiaceae bacterium]